MKKLTRRAAIAAVPALAALPAGASSYGIQYDEGKLGAYTGLRYTFGPGTTINVHLYSNVSAIHGWHIHGELNCE